MSEVTIFSFIAFTVFLQELAKFIFPRFSEIVISFALVVTLINSMFYFAQTILTLPLKILAMKFFKTMSKYAALLSAIGSCKLAKLDFVSVSGLV